MTADLNYWWVSVIVLAAILLITWLIRHDRKDQKDFEKRIIQSELKMDKHDAHDKDISV
jgi:short subunit fatty acids transporter